ncbi:NUDIX family hydrolase [Pseudomonas savastanoi pv. retacarpa]|nr:NUDIX family hydrolase [Pseudomonas savastanoi pv. retacarpa]
MRYARFHEHSQSCSRLTTIPADKAIQRCTLEFTRDKFNGIIVEPASLPNDPQALRDAVDALVTLIENERLALAWVTLPITYKQCPEHSDLHGCRVLCWR